MVISALNRVVDAAELRRVQRRRRLTSVWLIGFDVNSPALTTEHEEILDNVTQFLLDRSDSAVVSVLGRASQTGPESDNQSLSFDRAQTAHAYLGSAGLPGSRLGPVVAHGSGAPAIDIPGQEAEINRSVELWIDWEDVHVEPPPHGGPIGTSSDWKIDLSVTFGGGAGIGGQVQIGELTNRDTHETRPVQAMIAGLDIGHSLFVTAAADVGLPMGTDGEFSMPTPPGPVDFDWFDGRFVVLSAVGASAIVGGVDFATLRFRNLDGPWPEAKFADYPIGLTVGIGGLAMVGFLNVG